MFDPTHTAADALPQDVLAEDDQRTWARVEVSACGVHVGEIREVTRLGITFLQIIDAEDGKERFYSPAAVYSYHLITRAEVAEWIKQKHEFQVQRDAARTDSADIYRYVDRVKF